MTKENSQDTLGMLLEREEDHSYSSSPNCHTGLPLRIRSASEEFLTELCIHCFGRLFNLNLNELWLSDKLSK